MVKYDNILKAIEEYTVKCSVTLKGIKSQLAELFDDWTVRIRAGEDGEETYYDMALDQISRFYRDNYNNPDAVKTGFRMGDLVILMRNSPNGTALPTQKDLREQATYTTPLVFGVVCNKNGLTVTNKMDNVSPKSTDFNAPIFIRDSGLERGFWNRERENGVYEIRQDMKAGKISRDEANQEIQKVFVDYVDNDSTAQSTSLTRDFKKNNIPIESKYTKIKKNY